MLQGVIFDMDGTLLDTMYYWEHVGRTNDPKYMAHWAKKEAWYNKHFPGKLLTTFEGNEITTDAVALIEQHKQMRGLLQKRGMSDE